MISSVLALAVITTPSTPAPSVQLPAAVTTSPFTNSAINWDSGQRNDTITWTEFLVFTNTSFNDYIYVESFIGDGENGPIEEFYYYYCGSEADNYYLRDEKIVVGEWEALVSCGNNKLQIHFPENIVATYERKVGLGQKKNQFCSQIIRLLDF